MIAIILYTRTNVDKRNWLGVAKEWYYNNIVNIIIINLRLTLDSNAEHSSHELIVLY